MTGARFTDAKYVSWLKVNISLLFAKESLENFTDLEVDRFHSQLKASMQIRSPPTCYSCTKHALDKQWKRGQFHCYGGVCDQWLTGLRASHAHATSPVPWANVNVEQLPESAWECAKMFMTPGCTESNSAKGVDIAALVTLFQNCTHFHGFFKHLPVLTKVKDVRNRMMHSSRMEVEAESMQEDVAAIQQLLQDPQRLVNDPNCVEGASKIQELLSGELELSLNKELELRALNANIKMVQGFTDHLHATYSHIDRQVRRLQTDAKHVSQLKADYRQVHADIQTNKTSLQALEDVLTKCFGANELEHVDTDGIAASLNKVRTLDGQMGALKASLLEQERKVQQQSQKINQLDSDIIILQDEQKAMKRKLETTDAETTTKLLKQSSKEEKIRSLQCQLIDLYTDHHQGIPIYPLRPTWKHPMKTLYVPQSMRVVDHRGKPKVVAITPEDESKDIDIISFDEAKECKTSLRDMFFSDGSMCRRIYVTGEAGVGKSTLCQYIVSVWCRAHSSVKDKALTDHEAVMKEFSLLFYVKLNSAFTKHSQSDEIASLIEHQLELKEAANVRDCLTDRTTLVVMDSLDEYQQNILPKPRLNYKCAIMTTSRPWKVESLRTEIEGNIDRQIELTGLEKDTTNTLTDNVINVLNNEFKGEKTTADFMQHVKEKQMRKFLHIPVILVQMLCLWYNGQDIGNSLCQVYTNMLHHLIMVAVKTQDIPTNSNSSEKEFPLNCRDRKCACKRFGNLLWKLSRLAYDSLLGEVPVIFDHDEKQVDTLTEVEVDIALKMGILTQHTLFGNVTELKKSVDFVHRTQQDFLASIYLAKDSTDPNGSHWVYSYIPTGVFRILSNVLAYMSFRPVTEEGHDDKKEACRRLLSTLITDLDHALEVEQILKFTSGLNGQVACLLSELIMEKVSSDTRIEEYRNSCHSWREVPNAFLVKRIQNIIVQGVNEAQCNSDEKVLLQLHDVRLDWRNIGSVVPHIRGLDTARAKSISINTPADVTEQIWESIQHPVSIRKLHLHHNSAQRISEIVTTNHQSLQVLVLDDVDLTSLNETVVDILSVPNLSVLGIGSRVLFTHAQLNDICGKLSHLSQLKEIRLCGLSCATHGIDKDNCAYNVDMSKLNNLEKLHLNDLSAGKLVINPRNLLNCDLRSLTMNAYVSVFTNLTHAQKLQVFECWNVIGTEAINKLVELLPWLSSMQRIVLWGIDLSDNEKVKLSKNMKHLQVVKLWSEITMTTTTLRGLIDSLPAHSVRVQIGGFGVNPVVIKGGDVTEHVFKQLRECPGTTVIGDLRRMDEDGGEWLVKSFEFYTNMIS